MYSQPLDPPDRPTRPYKNFDEFLVEQRKHRVNAPTYPCLTCEGAKRIWDPEYESCPIEGMKMAPFVKCPSCKGTGETDRHDIKAAYDRCMAKYKKELAEYKAEKAIYDSGMAKLKAAKLSPDEKKALGLA